MYIERGIGSCFPVSLGPVRLYQQLHGKDYLTGNIASISSSPKTIKVVLVRNLANAV